MFCSLDRVWRKGAKALSEHASGKLTRARPDGNATIPPGFPRRARSPAAGSGGQLVQLGHVVVQAGKHVGRRFEGQHRDAGMALGHHPAHRAEAGAGRARGVDHAGDFAEALERPLDRALDLLGQDRGDGGARAARRGILWRRLVYGGVVRQFSATRAALGTLSGSVTINYASGSFQTLTTSGSISLAFSNFPASGSTALVSVEITVASAAHTVTVPAAVSVNTSGLVGINTSTNVITFGAAGVYTLQFVTSDGGSTITLNQVNSQLQALNASSEDLAASAAASLGVSDSYFSTSGAETATLAAGVNGQVKTFAMYAKVGNMVITVTNPGWGGAGTMTFNAVGQACTLKYINSKWFCIGNNGVAFA